MSDSKTNEDRPLTKRFVVARKEIDPSMPDIVDSYTKENYGWGNGYVAIRPDHAYFGIHYDDVPVTVHGGLTYSRPANSNFTDKDIPGDYWVLGFDTAHGGDGDKDEFFVVSQTVLLERQLMQKANNKVSTVFVACSKCPTCNNLIEVADINQFNYSILDIDSPIYCENCSMYFEVVRNGLD